MPANFIMLEQDDSDKPQFKSRSSEPVATFGTKDIVRPMTLDDFHVARTIFSQDLHVRGSEPALLSISENKDSFYIYQQENTPIACLASIIYPGLKFEWKGYYGVLESHRQKGFGKKMWDVVTAVTSKQFSDGVYTSGLDAFSDHVKLYESRLGYKTTSYDLRMELTINQSQSTDDLELKPYRDFFNELSHYDMLAFGDKRADFLSHWLTKNNTKIILALDSSSDLQGYGVLNGVEVPAGKDIQYHHYIGPVYAEDEKIAEQIVERLTQVADKTKNIYVEFPEKQYSTAKLLTKFGFQSTKHEGKPLKINRLHRLFGSDVSHIKECSISEKLYCHTWLGLG